MKDAQRRMGYFCNLVPAEVITAAGMQPVRVTGKAETTATADAYLCSNLCPYVKNLFTTALDGTGGKFDGVVFARSCDGMRRMYDAWKSYINPEFIYMLEVPKNNDELAAHYYAAQLRELVKSLGQAFQKEIKTADLTKAIRATNKSRRIMRDIYSGQQSSPLPVKGSDLFKLGLDSMGANGKAGASEPEGDSRNTQHGKVYKEDGRKPRILISGNVMDRPDLFEMIEEAGADVPVADICTALRYFNRDVDEKNGDPYLALAQAYLAQPHCSRTGSPAQRVDEIRKLIKLYGIDGVLLTSVKFCDLQLYDAPYLVKSLTEAGTPVLFLENDYTFSSRSQMKVRVEAFIETLDQGGK